MRASVSVEIRYLASLRDRVGLRKDQVSFPAGAKLRDVAQWLCEQRAVTVPSAEVMAILNSQGWEQLPLKLQTEIREGDVICLFPPIAGG